MAVLKEQLESDITALPVEIAIKHREIAGRVRATPAGTPRSYRQIITPFGTLRYNLGAPKMCLGTKLEKFSFWQATVNGQPATIYRASVRPLPFHGGHRGAFRPPLVAAPSCLRKHLLSPVLVFAVWLASWAACLRRMSGLLRIHAALTDVSDDADSDSCVFQRESDWQRLRESNPCPGLERAVS